MPIPVTGDAPGTREGGAGLDIRPTVVEGTTVLTVRGELDMQTVPTLRSHLADALARDGAVVVDLDGVDFIDSTGLAALLNALRRLTRAGRRLVIVAGEGPVLRMLRLTRLDSTFVLAGSPAGAHAILHPRAAA